MAVEGRQQLIQRLIRPTKVTDVAAVDDATIHALNDQEAKRKIMLGHQTLARRPPN